LLFYTVSIPLLESLQLRSSCHFFVQDFPVWGKVKIETFFYQLDTHVTLFSDSNYCLNRVCNNVNFMDELLVKANLQEMHIIKATTQVSVIFSGYKFFETW
jgi:hypothetical protein